MLFYLEVESDSFHSVASFPSATLSNSELKVNKFPCNMQIDTV